MKHRFVLFLLCAFLVCFSCSDGDVIEFEFDFDEDFEACEDNNNLILYNTKEDPSESISVQYALSTLSLEDIFEGIEPFAQDTLENNNVTFLYRTYNRPDLPSSLFCTSIPPANLNIAVDQDSPCRTEIIRLLIEDDNDGVPSELESTSGLLDPLGDEDSDGVLNYLDDNPNDPNIGDDNTAIETDFDTDGDGLPNFLDEDDDGDNVLTSNEIGDLTDLQDSDEDGTPDYLDNDDDGDGVLTRDEENDTQDQNPLNDITNSDIGPDFLNSNVNTAIPASAYRQHNISQTRTIRLLVFEIDIDFLSQAEFNFGTLKTSTSGINSNRTVTPDFP